MFDADGVNQLGPSIYRDVHIPVRGWLASRRHVSCQQDFILEGWAPLASRRPRNGIPRRRKQGKRRHLRPIDLATWKCQFTGFSPSLQIERSLLNIS